MTLTRMMQVVTGAMLAPVRVTEVPPAMAVNEAEPPQLVNVGETGLARKTLAGRVSAMEAWVKVSTGSLLRIEIAN